MIANHVHDALAQVRQLQARVIQGQLFRGYSGWARIGSGFVALAGAAVMSAPFYPRTVNAHVAGWATVLAISLALNGGALLNWFLRSPEVARDPRRLKPIIDLFPPLFVGAVLGLVFLRNGDSRYLFGVWMSLFGLANVASRHYLPRGVYYLGLFYLACGTVCLLARGTAFAFTNPWPMGAVFFVGEVAGGMILRAMHAGGEAAHRPRMNVEAEDGDDE